MTRHHGVPSACGDGSGGASVLEALCDCCGVSIECSGREENKGDKQNGPSRVVRKGPLFACDQRAMRTIPPRTKVPGE